MTKEVHFVTLLWKLRLKGQQFITEGTHEAIVGREEFEKAQLVIKSNSHKVLMGGVDFPLKGKVRCGNCRRVMAHNFKQAVPTFWCREGLELVGQTQCTSEVFQVSDIENAVFQALKKEADKDGVILVHVITFSGDGRARGRIAHFDGATGFLIHPVQIGLGIRNFRLNLKNVCTDSICQIFGNFCGDTAGRKIGDKSFAHDNALPLDNFV